MRTADCTPPPRNSSSCATRPRTMKTTSYDATHHTDGSARPDWRFQVLELSLQLEKRRNDSTFKPRVQELGGRRRRLILRSVSLMVSGCRRLLQQFAKDTGQVSRLVALFSQQSQQNVISIAGESALRNSAAAVDSTTLFKQKKSSNGLVISLQVHQTVLESKTRLKNRAGCEVCVWAWLCMSFIEKEASPAER